MRPPLSAQHPMMGGGRDNNGNANANANATCTQPQRRSRRRSRHSQSSATYFLILSALLMGNQMTWFNEAHDRANRHPLSKHEEMEVEEDHHLNFMSMDNSENHRRRRRKLSDLGAGSAVASQHVHAESSDINNKDRIHKDHPTRRRRLGDQQRPIMTEYDSPDYANETLFPPPPSTQPKSRHQPAGGFAACLLIKDDNHLLDEWIAYHSTVLPLRYLLVAIDPMSHQNPFPILKKWNNTARHDADNHHNEANVTTTAFNFTIDVWTDANYIHERQMHRVCNEYHDLNMLKNHRSRQSVFMQRCAIHMKQRGMDWTIMTDSDEFLTFNPIADDEELAPTRLKSSAHGALREHLTEARKRLPASGVGDNTTVYDFLMQEKDKLPWKDKSCVLLPRLLFSSVESTPEGQRRLLQATAEYGIDDVLSLNTQRFFRTAGKARTKSHEYNKLGKPILDLSRLDMDADLQRKFMNPHNPIPACGATHARFDESLLRVHHYLGTADQYGARRDVRRSDEVYMEKARLEKGINFDLQPWLGRFVRTVGKERAQMLLKDAGKVLNEDPFDLCDGGKNENVPVPWVPHYLMAALERLKEKGTVAEHLK